MPIRHFRELITGQVADAFETEVTELVLKSPTASRDFRYRSEVLDALTGVPSNIAEGFERRSPRDTCRFFDYALSSLSEVEVRLNSGIKQGHFTAVQCEAAFRLARRTLTAAVRDKQSQQRYLRLLEARKAAPRPRTDTPRPPGSDRGHR